MVNHSCHFPIKSLVFVIALLLLSCSSPTTKQQQTEKDILSNEQGESTERISAQEYLALAEKLPGEQAIAALISASKQFIQEKNYRHALWLANQLSPLAPTDAEQYQLALVKAQSLLAVNEIERAYQAINTADVISQTEPLKHTLNYYQILSDIQQNRRLTVATMDAKLRAFDLMATPTDEAIIEIWTNLAKMQEWQVKQLRKLNPPQIKGWFELLEVANKFGNSPQQLARYLAKWQRQHASHPAQLIVEQLATKVEGIQPDIKNIAVIIPLSGKQQAAGKAVQQGILAAYHRDTGKTLHFIDSNQLDMNSLDEQFSALEINYVIGPLLKPNVDSYLQLNLSTPTLLLNLPDQANQLLAHQSAISMRPEDEAIQAATVLSSREYKHPMVISAQDNVSQRIAKTFVQQWQLISGTQPEILVLSADKKMQDELKASLDVNLSQDRIKELKRRLKQKLEIETRNRRDIDMIYLVGSAQETRLLKPYIDVNISPFAELIPVFASSRSHGAKVDESISRDLNGLVFTEMPWLLTSKQQNKALVQISNKLWPQRSESLQKIFAMGYDSIALVEKLAAMKQMPYLRHYGQTGTLKLNEDNILIRSLLWGRYQRNKVQEFALN
ncbi:penicillin-binding protein activator [Colwelliaceae bacterium 6471]